MDYFKESLISHKRRKGKINFDSKVEIKNKDDLSIAYSPWVAEPCKEIVKDPESAYDYTIKSNTIAVISDGTAVLGLGDIGPLAALPVMEGKCVLLKKFWWVNAFPLVLDTKDTEEIIKTIKIISPTIGGINLEDISAPRCFEIENRLKKELDIPVFHDDQHGTAIICLAGLINSLKIVGKNIKDTKVVINGVWAAGIAIAELFIAYGVKDIIMVDSKGVIYKGRDSLNPIKEMIADMTNTACTLDADHQDCIKWWLDTAVRGRDVFVWVSVWGILTQEMVRSMNEYPIIFAMANPIPEIMPKDAKQAGAKIIATWRSDFPNQLNNVLVFPGIFKGALTHRVKDITQDMQIKAAVALANYVKNPNPDRIIPSVFDEWIADIVADVIR